MVTSPITRFMRFIWAFAGLAVFAAFTLLFVFGEDTRALFAWTINPPAAAAFLGAGYGAIVVSSLLSLFAKHWGQIRAPYAVLFLGLVFILLATLLHLDRFHFWREDFVPRNVAIGWMVLYGLIPPLMIAGFIGQARAGIHVEPSRHPLPVWAKVAFGFVALVTGLVGSVFFIAPTTATSIWFWPLTPLLARMVAAWLIGVSSAAALMITENDLSQSYISAITLIAYAILQGTVLLRYSHVVNWAAPMAWVWVFTLAVLVIVNSWMLLASTAQNIFQKLDGGLTWKQNA
jgi:hypothetical protein